MSFSMIIRFLRVARIKFVSLLMNMYSKQNIILFQGLYLNIWQAIIPYIQHAINVSDTPNLTLTGDPLSTNSSSKIHISQEALITFIRSTNVTIKNLGFFTAAETSHSVFSFESSRVSIVDTRFEGPSGNVSLLMVSSSTIEIVGSTFKGFVALAGPAITAVASDIITSDCYFIGNKALSTGGVIFAENGSIRTSFKNNSAFYGGVIACFNCTLNIASNVTFISNSALGYGGALYLYETTVVLSGAALFYNNTAQYAGAVSICVTHFQYTLTDPKYLNFTGNTATLFGGAILHSDCVDKTEG